MMNTEDAVLLKQALNGTYPSVSSSTLLRLTHAHRIQALLYDQLKRNEATNHWPPEIVTEFARAWRAGAVADALIQIELPRVLSALASSRVHPILMKGTPLSYTHYPEPNVRPHADVDLLIRKQDLKSMEVTMQQLGYEPYNSTSGELVSHQVLYRKTHHSGTSFDFDFHWKLCNPKIFSDVLSYEDCERTAVRIPALGEHARGLFAPFALLLACIHRVGHHHDDQRLIWLYDIHLLVEQMTSAEFQEFVALATTKQMKAVCADGLRLAQDWFGTKWPADFAGDVAFEPSQKFLANELSRVDQLRLDLSQLRGFGKLRLLLEHLFPPADYMLHRYATSTRLALPALYIHRAATGLRKWLRHGAQPSRNGARTF